MTTLIVTPTRGRSVDSEYAVGLMHSAGVHNGWMPMSGQSDIYVARNSLANEFLRTTHDDMICIDSDIGFTRDDLLNLISSPYPFVSGVYPSKTRAGSPVLVLEDDKVPLPTEGFVKAKYVPGGFLKIHRSVFDAIKPFASEYGPVDKPNYQFYNGIIEDRMLLSEDYSFCILAKKAGFTPMVNCKIRLKHDGLTL